MVVFGLKRMKQERWVILVAATLSMMVIGLYQYSWTLFAKPVSVELKSTLAAVQLTFTIFTTLMTFAQPVAGIVADRRGPLLLNLIGGAITGFGWLASSYANSVEALYLTYGTGSLGVGILYATAVGVANKWFPDRRGLATGFVSFGYGFGAAVMNPLISWIIGLQGFRSAFLHMGGVMLLSLIALGFLSSYPPADWLPKASAQRVKSGASVEAYQFRPAEMVGTSQWWLIYSAFILTSQTGLMIAAQLTSLGESFNLSPSIVLLTTVIFPLTNGLGRIVGGRVSDHLGREVTMTIFFTLQGILSLFLLGFGSKDVVFVTIVSLIGFFWGPIFTFFPSIIGDYYGRRYSTVNYGITYTAKAWGGWIGGYIAALLSSLYGFSFSIILSAAFSFTAVILVSPKTLSRPIAGGPTNAL